MFTYLVTYAASFVIGTVSTAVGSSIYDVGKCVFERATASPKKKKRWKREFEEESNQEQED
jgi:hypothetical protein